MGKAGKETHLMGNQKLCFKNINFEMINEHISGEAMTSKHECRVQSGGLG